MPCKLSYNPILSTPDLQAGNVHYICIPKAHLGLSWESRRAGYAVRQSQKSFIEGHTPYAGVGEGGSVRRTDQCGT